MAAHLSLEQVRKRSDPFDLFVEVHLRPFIGIKMPSQSREGEVLEMTVKCVRWGSRIG